jgi:hypothetical protein
MMCQKQEQKTVQYLLRNVMAVLICVRAASTNHSVNNIIQCVKQGLLL